MNSFSSPSIEVPPAATGTGEPWQIGNEGAFTVKWHWQTAVEARPDFDARMEWFVVFYLDAERRLIGHTVMPKGYKSWVDVPYDQVLRPALAVGASGIVAAHNHPGGASPHPSPGDRMHALHLRRLCELLKLELLDEVIIAESGCVSFAGNGMLSNTPDEQEREEEAVAYLNEADRCSLAVRTLTHPVLQPLLFDAAQAAGLALHDYVVPNFQSFMIGHLANLPGSEPQWAFLSQIIKAHDHDAFHRALADEAADFPSWKDWAWAVGQEAAAARVLKRMELNSTLV